MNRPRKSSPFQASPSKANQKGIKAMAPNPPQFGPPRPLLNTPQPPLRLPYLPPNGGIRFPSCPPNNVMPDGGLLGSHPSTVPPPPVFPTDYGPMSGFVNYSPINQNHLPFSVPVANHNTLANFSFYHNGFAPGFNDFRPMNGFSRETQNLFFSGPNPPMMVSSFPTQSQTTSSFVSNPVWLQNSSISNGYGNFENTQKTIVMENEDDIEMVNMDDIDYFSEGSPYDPNQDISLLDVDFNLSQEINEHQLTPAKNNINISKHKGKPIVNEEEYWSSTLDCDYRILDSGSNSEAKPKNRKRLSRRKCKRLKKKKEVIVTCFEDTTLFDISDTTKTNLDNIDEMPVETLISMYNQIKEEITLLSCGSNTDDKINNRTDDSISIKSLSNDEAIDENCPIIEVFDDADDSIQFLGPVNECGQTKEEETKLNLVLNTESDLGPTIKEIQSVPILSVTIQNEQVNSPKESNTPSPSNQRGFAKEITFGDGDLNENLLREQLIRNMLEAQMRKANKLPGEANSLYKSVKPVEPLVVPSSLSVTLPPSPKPTPPSVQSPRPKESLEVPPAKLLTETVKPKIDYSRFRLVIELSGDESSDIEENTQIANKRQKTPKRVRTKSNSRNTPLVIHKLSSVQREEYKQLRLKEDELKKKINDKKKEETKKKTLTDEHLLSCEQKLKEYMLSCDQKNKKIAILNKQVTFSMKQLTKAQNEARHLEKLLHAANKKARVFSTKFQHGQQQKKDIEISLTIDNKNVENYKQMCIKIGQKLRGPTYELPIPKPVDPIVKNETKRLKQRMKSFDEIKVNLANRVNKDMEKATKFLRYQIKHLLKPNPTYEAVLLFQHYINFNFIIFQSTLFFQSNNLKIEFNQFSELSELQKLPIDSYPNLTPERLTMENYESVLQHFNSYRFASHQNFDISSDCWSNAINPNQFICIYELFGVCNDQNCAFQHQKNYIYDAQEKIVDVLTYLPQVGDSLNLKDGQNDPKTLRSALTNYVQTKLNGATATKENIQKICKDISSEIKNQSKTSISSFLIRSLPKELVSFNSENVPTMNMNVPCGDHLYRFDLKDESFQMKLSKLCNFSANDPDFYLRNRFFAPEGMPVSAQLEASLATDPHNIQMWINLAYCYLKKIRDGEQDINECIDSSLNVLSRALEVNRTNAELYEHYLVFYSNKLDLLAADDSVDPTQDVLPIEEICTRILKFCSSYRLWICYLSLCKRLPDKQRIVMELLQRFCSEEIQVDNDEQRSLNILEIVMYRINLFLQLNQHQQAVMFFKELFNEGNKSLSEAHTNTLIQLGQFITKRHRVFAWLCYIHLILYRCLPYHCFQLSKKSCFLHLVDIRPFVFDWRSHSETDLGLVEKILNRAIKNCCINHHDLSDENPQLGCHKSECQNSCFSLRFNLAQLNKLIQIYRQNAQQSNNAISLPINSYRSLSIVFSDNFDALSHLHILQLFDVNLQSANKNDEIIVLDLTENFYNSYNHQRLCDITEMTDDLLSVLSHQIQFNYWLAYYNYKFGNTAKCKLLLKKSLSYYFCDIDVFQCDSTGVGSDQSAYVMQLFELVLFDDFTFDESVSFDQQETIKGNLKIQGEKRACRLAYLYLSYLMFLHITLAEGGSDLDRRYLKLDCTFSSVINSFTSANLTNNEDYKLLWLNYFLILLDFPYNDAHFKSVYETLRLICVTFNSTDPIFIYHLVSAFSEMIVPCDRLYFLIELSKLNPENSNLIVKVLNFALMHSKKETCWNYITSIIYGKRIQLQCFEFWKIAISLSIERNDHLNTHKFFQIAIPLMPFNIQLWEMLKNYETSINHTDHLVQLKRFYQHTLQMDHKLFDS